MKVATKLALAVILIMVGVFAIRAYQSAERQTQAIESGIKEVHFMIGRALRPALKEIWRSEGRDRALEVLAVANDRIGRARHVSIRWVPHRPELAPGNAALPPALTRTVDEDTTVVRKDGERLLTFVPIVMESRIAGALEISEPLTSYHADVRAEVVGVLRRSAYAALGSILAVSVLGFVIVGRPMRRLADKARRIGSGDLEGPVIITQRDEIGELAREVNEMCHRLRTAQQQIQQETAARMGALTQLRHADRLTTVGTLASGIAHELGTPLAVVSGRAKMIASGEVCGADSVASARVIVEQVGRITTIIRQLLDFARRRAPERGRHSLLPLADQTLDLLRPMAKKKQVVLIPPEHRPRIAVDVEPTQIQQALANLVINGIQAMPAGGQVEVSVGTALAKPPADRARPASEYAYVAVRDHGVGIAPEHLGRVFEPFFTTKEIGEGTGLGLSVAHGIARDHDGWIDVQSEVGTGSRFTLYLPTAASAP